MVAGDPGDIGVYAPHGQEKDIDTDPVITHGLKMVVPHAQDYVLRPRITVSAFDLIWLLERCYY